MWATINNHSDVVAILLEHGACSKARSRQGRTVMDLVDTENEQLIHILDTTTDNEVDAEKKRIRRKSLRELHLQTTSDYDQSTQQETKSHNDPTDAYEKELINCEASIRSIHKFAWDRCLPDQMFVFSEENIDHILDTTITRLTLPMKSRQEIYVPANVLFLSVRFAHYYSSKELLNAFLNSALQRISDVLKANTDDIHTLAFWTSNLSQLLYYFKKDTGLVVATAEHQLEMSELICETYTLIVADSARRIDKILEQSMLEHEPFQEQVSFADDYWPRLFRRRPTSISTAAELTSPTSPCSPRLMSPRSVTSLLGSILYVLQSYEVHPAIILQAVAQFCHFLSCEMFNRILTSKRYLCRSKALQIRMNLSVIEEWMRDSQLPSNLTSYFNSLVQLLQLLQCVSGLNELMLFVNTVRTFDLLNPLQIRRCVLSYRYEVNEPKLPEEVEKYALQIAQDTVRPRRESVRNSFSASATPSSRPTSVSSLGSLLMSSMTRVGRNSSNPPPQPPAEEVEPAEDEAMEEEEDPDCLREWTVEKRDSRYMLPFSLPATWSQKKPAASVAAAAQDNDVQGEKDSVSEAMCQEYKQKLCAQRDLHTRDRAIVPTIPEDWLDRLDSKLES
ncbi:DIL domain-domain-containing protein [Syncephalastrum racemosum]|uniref:DIL domain-domain-containing protein n=1 Tax=Syncephalastrum racemosum TaxID=13706 RepID=A0A1X2HE08_SYNRA|nr:DIL domain-domain-containing protein [Syncephalastrum racemosum]